MQREQFRLLIGVVSCAAFEVDAGTLVQGAAEAEGQRFVRHLADERVAETERGVAIGHDELIKALKSQLGVAVQEAEEAAHEPLCAERRTEHGRIAQGTPVSRGQRIDA